MIPIPKIVPATTEDYAELIAVWELSVRATHHFLAEKDLLAIRTSLAEVYFPAVGLFKFMTPATGEVVAFAGIAGNKLEMLFVRPEYMGRGIGKALLDFAVRGKGVSKVDVNEQNTAATGFYLSQGFRILSRDETDVTGLPYPVLHLSL